jgi:hypothetical protein
MQQRTSSNPYIVSRRNVFVNRELKSDFNDWKSQILPSEFVNAIKEQCNLSGMVVNCVNPKSCVENTDFILPPILFQLRPGFVDEFISSLPVETAFDHWYRWNLDNDSNVLRIVTINSR